MDNAGYAALTRQSGLMNEMRLIANNIANTSTTGYRQEGIIFSEYVADIGEAPSLSMATGRVKMTSQSQGALTQTGNPFDLAIEGDGYFQIETTEGLRLTRAGHFTPNAEGDLVTPDGHRVLDAGGAPVFVPTDLGTVGIAADGTVSAGGTPLAQIGVVQPSDPTALMREQGTLFVPEGEVLPVENGRILQGFLEESNVSPVLQISRMIEVQRAYELGQSFLENEDERMRSVFRLLGR
ncbi:flagellar hook-basal body complex protein [Aestuariibius sp. 2305UL40-4]|uniref:flagellar hook-basal body complex protein n=1 Tax=Aestuariibius violaceus TaxID=3234132 RepID=UPI00345EFCB6